MRPDLRWFRAESKRSRRSGATRQRRDAASRSVSSSVVTAIPRRYDVTTGAAALARRRPPVAVAAFAAHALIAARISSGADAVVEAVAIGDDVASRSTA